jgi:hypothetical protein
VNKTLALCSLLLSVGCTDAASVTIQWTFAGGSCAAASVNNVTVQIGAITATVPCTDPTTGVDGATIAGIPGGTQSYALSATANDGAATLYEASGTFSILAGLDNNVGTINLAPQTSTASVAFQWTFAGSTCVGANVDLVQIAIAGTTIQVGCIDAASGVAGVTLSGIPLGTQNFTLTGYTPTYDTNLNYTGDVATFQLAAAVTVQGGMVNSTGVLDLPYISQPPNNANSNIIFLWTFEGKSCATSSPQVTTVNLFMNGQSVNVNQQCDVAGLMVKSFAAGTYPFTLTATAGSVQYTSSGNATVDGVQTITINSDLQQQVSSSPGAGDAVIAFTFGTSGQNCQQVGLDTVHFALTDATGAVVSGSSLTQACTGATTVTFSGLSGPNVYYLYIQGLAQGTTTYQVSGYQFTVVPSPTASSYSVVVPKL